MDMPSSDRYVSPETLQGAKISVSRIVFPTTMFPDLSSYTSSVTSLNILAYVKAGEKCPPFTAETVRRWMLETIHHKREDDSYPTPHFQEIFLEIHVHLQNQHYLWMTATKHDLAETLLTFLY